MSLGTSLHAQLLIGILFRRQAKVNADPSCNDFPDEDESESTSDEGSDSGEDEPPPAVESGPRTSHLVVNKHSKEEFTPLPVILGVEEYPRKFRTVLRVKDRKPEEIRQWVQGYCQRCNLW